MRKTAVILLSLTVLAVGARAAQKLQHRVIVRQVNEWQAIVACRNGRTPSLNKEAVAGVVIVSCEGREE